MSIEKEDESYHKQHVPEYEYDHSKRRYLIDKEYHFHSIDGHGIFHSFPHKKVLSTKNVKTISTCSLFLPISDQHRRLNDPHKGPP